MREADRQTCTQRDTERGKLRVKNTERGEQVPRQSDV